MNNRKSPLVLVLGILAFLFVLVVLVAGFALTGVKNEKVVGGDKQALFSKKGARLGVLEVSGVIMDAKKALERIEKFSNDKTIKGVIVRINSPGGAVAPSQEIYQALKKLAQEKPVYASMSSVAASGGYYVAVGCQKIFADPGTMTGSIGVIMQFMDLSRLYEWAKVKPYNMKTGKFKDIGNPEREMGPEEKALIQGLIDNVLAQFRKAVAEGRKLSMEKVIAASDGRIFSGEQAKELGLVDELGGLNDTSAALANELKIPGKPVLVYPQEHRRLFIERLFSDGEEEDSMGSESVSDHLISALVQRILGPQAAALPASSAQPQVFGGPMYLMPFGR